MDNTPVLSIITVTRNDAKGLECTMRNIAAQGRDDIEHLIIDGASTDGSQQVAESLATPYTTIISEHDRGIYDAMNKGLAKARGKYVMFVNAGDTLHNDHTLNDIIDAIYSNEEPGVIYGQTVIVGGDDRHEIGPRHLEAPRELTLKSFREGMVVCHQAFVALRRITPRFDIKYKYSADYEWCIRVLQHSRHNLYLPQVLIDFLDGGATTLHRGASLLERYQIMCYYYGRVGSTLRHIKFAIRALRRHINKSRNNR